MSAYQFLATTVALSMGLVVWCWVGVVHGVRRPEATPLRKLTSTVSLLALSLSWLVLALLIIAPAQVLGIRGHELHFGPFILGCGAALIGGVFAAAALTAVRKPLGLSAGTVLVLWLIVLSG